MPSVQVNFTDEEWALLNDICRSAFLAGQSYSKREVIRWLVRNGSQSTAVSTSSGMVSAALPSPPGSSGSMPEKSAGASRFPRPTGVTATSVSPDTSPTGGASSTPSLTPETGAPATVARSTSTSGHRHSPDRMTAGIAFCKCGARRVSGDWIEQ